MTTARRSWSRISWCFAPRARRSLDWQVILVVDVSGSMEASVIYSALMAAILSGLPSVKTHFVAFSTGVVDLSDRVDDPLGLLLEVDVGGGTDIALWPALRPPVDHRADAAPWSSWSATSKRAGRCRRCWSEVRAIAESGAHPLGLAALDDRGPPRYSQAVAEAVVAAGMPVAALTPLELARWVGEQIR